MQREAVTGDHVGWHRRGDAALTHGLTAALTVGAAPARPLADAVGATDAAHGAGAGPRARPAPAGAWIAEDLHVHTTYSHDSYGGPDDDNTRPDEFDTAGQSVEQAFRQAHLRGLDFLAISDHNDVRSQSDPGFDRFGAVGPPAYEKSLSGHAQMLGARHVYEVEDESAAGIRDLAEQLRSDGGAFQINHPTDAAGGLDWSCGYDVVPDTVEAWSITSLWQPPMPSANDDEGNIAYWEGWLDRGEHVAVVGASLTGYSGEEVATAAEWIALYRQHRGRFTGVTYPLLDDPLGGTTWTALQPWDAAAQRGALLVCRQDAPETQRDVRLRGIRGDGDYRVTDARTGELVGVFSAEELRAGLPVSLPERHSAAVLFVDPA